jgi:hypothetical protein
VAQTQIPWNLSARERLGYPVAVSPGSRLIAVSVALAGTLLWTSPGTAANDAPSDAVRGRIEARAQEDPGRPRVKLDHLDFPEVLGASQFKEYLRRRLQRQARQLDWGAGRDSTIEYRFAIEKLEVVAKGRVLKVRCTASGMLPKGKTARSQLEFGGDGAQRSQVIRQVLDIVARGVLTRLAELERTRRGQAPYHRGDD